MARPARPRARRPVTPPPPDVRALLSELAQDDLDLTAEEGNVPAGVLALQIDANLAAREWAGTTSDDRAARAASSVGRSLYDEFEKSLMAQESWDDVEQRLLGKMGVGKMERDVGGAGLQMIEQNLDNEARLSWNEGLLAANRQEDTVLVWRAVLDEATTPGCWDNHGHTVDELDDEVPPRHERCRCELIVVPDPESDDEEWARLGRETLEAMAQERDEGWAEMEASRSRRVREAMRPSRLWGLRLLREADENCGTGAGGFQAGNTCAKGSGVNDADRLDVVRRTAAQYDKFEDFERDWRRNYHGIYWHLTDRPDFTIDPKHSPRDASSMASGGDGEPGLMVTTDIENWAETLGAGRKYAAQIDLTGLKPGTDFRDTTRGFGQEMYVFKPGAGRVMQVMPLAKALKVSAQDYAKRLPNSEGELRALWERAHRKREVRWEPSSSS